MGWKGTLRSIASAARAAAREEQRRLKVELKAQMVADAAAAVHQWQTKIHEIRNVHLERLDQVDWKKFRDEGISEPQNLSGSSFLHLEDALNNFSSHWYDFLFGGTEKRRRSLESELAIAKKKEKERYDKIQSQYLRKIQVKELAGRVLSKDIEAFPDALEMFLPRDLPIEQLEFDFDRERFIVSVKIFTDEIVPSFRLKQLQSGKLSETKMPKGEFFDIYSNYVAAVAFRIANDIFSILPIAQIHLNCGVEMLNPKTGHLEDTPVLSVLFVRDTMTRLNTDAIVPFEALRNFNHHVDFKKTRGFVGIKELTL